MSQKPNESVFERTVSRRELLEKAGKVGAAALVAGSLAGPAAASTKSRRATPKKVPTGGTVTWAEWDAKLNNKSALAESYDVVNSKRIVWNLRKGVKFHNGQEFTATDAKYSFDQILNPPLPGTTALT